MSGSTPLVDRCTSETLYPAGSLTRLNRGSDWAANAGWQPALAEATSRAGHTLDVIVDNKMHCPRRIKALFEPSRITSRKSTEVIRSRVTHGHSHLWHQHT